MAKEFRYGWLRRLGNALVTPLIKLGVGPSGLHLLSVDGRKSGKTYTTPVNLIRRHGVRYLVSPYGERSWVKNAHAAGEVRLRRGGRQEQQRIRELTPHEAAPVLRAYRRLNPVVAPYFEARPGDTEAAFEAEASRHPVFRLE
jgi:deazaflavin-dependent oxidoreductase (nitroreductase family)